MATDTIYDKIRNFKYLMMNPDLASLVPDNLETYDPFIIREALNNAIAHQDYGCHGMINVVEEEDRLIFTNLGRFIPDSVRSVLENDAPEEHYRNKMLTNAMVEPGMVDTIGSGIKRMFDKQRERLFPMPDYDFSDNRVKVTIVGKVLDIYWAVIQSYRRLTRVRWDCAVAGGVFADKLKSRIRKDNSKICKNFTNSAVFFRVLER